MSWSKPVDLNLNQSKIADRAADYRSGEYSQQSASRALIGSERAFTSASDTARDCRRTDMGPS
jgi:hypothetical protein